MNKRILLGIALLSALGPSSTFGFGGETGGGMDSGGGDVIRARAFTLQNFLYGAQVNLARALDSTQSSRLGMTVQASLEQIGMDDLKTDALASTYKIEMDCAGTGGADHASGSAGRGDRGGDICLDFENLLETNPSPGELYRILIHEHVHHLHADWSERRIDGLVSPIGNAIAGRLLANPEAGVTQHPATLSSGGQTCLNLMAVQQRFITPYYRYFIQTPSLRIDGLDRIQFSQGVSAYLRRLSQAYYQDGDDNPWGGVLDELDRIFFQFSPSGPTINGAARIRFANSTPEIVLAALSEGTPQEVIEPGVGTMFFEDIFLAISQNGCDSVLGLGQTGGQTVEFDAPVLNSSRDHVRVDLRSLHEDSLLTEYEIRMTGGVIGQTVSFYERFNDRMTISCEDGREDTYVFDMEIGATVSLARDPAAVIAERDQDLIPTLTRMQELRGRLWDDTCSVSSRSANEF